MEDTDFDRALQNVAAARLNGLDRRYTWIARGLLVAMIVFVALGVWVDWRWLPMAVIAAFLLTVAAWGGSRITLEIRRRTRENLLIYKLRSIEVEQVGLWRQIELGLAGQPPSEATIRRYVELSDDRRGLLGQEIVYQETTDEGGQ